MAVAHEESVLFERRFTHHRTDESRVELLVVPVHGPGNLWAFPSITEHEAAGIPSVTERITQLLLSDRARVTSLTPFAASRKEPPVLYLFGFERGCVRSDAGRYVDLLELWEDMLPSHLPLLQMLVLRMAEYNQTWRNIASNSLRIISRTEK